MANLPGVKVGPLDPDSTAGFGHIASHNNARQLIRLHRQMHPPELLRALARPLDEARTKGIDLDEVGEYIGGLSHPNGDPVLPQGARVSGAAVRGDRQTGQVLTFTYTLPSGRVGKWYAPYGPEELPASFDAGAEFAKVAEMKDRGVVAFDSEGTQTEILRRQLAESRREAAALRRAAERRGTADDVVGPGDSAELDTRDSANIAEENEQLRREVQELRERFAQQENLEGAGGGFVPTGGLEQDFPPRDNVASADPPFEGYDDLKADDVCKRLKAGETSDEERRAILDYERTHANRKSVVGAAEESLSSAG